MATSREKIIELIEKMRLQTVDRGCTPAEAAAFAARCAKWIEEYQIGEAELRGAGAKQEDYIEVCENIINTGKKVHNPGMAQMVSQLARGMCCECILKFKGKEAVFGIVGEVLDAEQVCQVALTVVPALQIMARMEGVEHGYEKSGLIRWCNQYLTAAGIEIFNRLYTERKERAEEREKQYAGSCALVITGETLAVEKRQAASEVFKKLYPHTKQTHQRRTEYIHDAHQRGAAAGKNVGLHVGVGSNSSSVVGQIE